MRHHTVSHYSKLIHHQVIASTSKNIITPALLLERGFTLQHCESNIAQHYITILVLSAKVQETTKLRTFAFASTGVAHNLNLQNLSKTLQKILDFSLCCGPAQIVQMKMRRHLLWILTVVETR
jgi:hypothetical protein